MSTSSNPYLDWLDHNATPPAALSNEAWKLAANVLIQRLRTARQAVLGLDPLPAVELYLESENKLDALAAWVSHSCLRTPRIQEETINAELSQLRRRRERVAKTAGKGRGLAVLDGLLRRRRQPLAEAQRSIVKDLRDLWRQSKTVQICKSDIQTERLLAKHYKREEHYLNECFENGVQLNRRQAYQLPALFRQQARLAAKQRGMKTGWFVTADSDLGREALFYLEDRDLRESLWRQRQAVKETAASISEVLRLRHEEAVRNGHEHYASYQVQNRAIGQVRSVSALLNGFLENSRTSAIKMNRRLAEVAAEFGIEEVKPWDRFWLTEKLRQNMRFSHEPARSFSLENAVNSIIPELLGIAGWDVASITLTGEGRRRQWVYELVKEASSLDGAPQRRAQFWFAPFNPKNHESPNEGGYEQIVRNRWRGVGAESPLARSTDSLQGTNQEDGVSALGMPLVVVVLGLKATTRWISWQELTWLVHEMGHVMHDLDLDPIMSNYTGCLSTDIVEFPSQLLERLTHDPEVLARWASCSQGVDPIARRPMFWRKWLATDISCIDLIRRFALDALVDLTIHRQKIVQGEVIDPQVIYRRIAERYDVSIHDDDRSGYAKFIWGSYASSNYTYILGQMLARVVISTRKEGGIDGEALSREYAAILKNVLSPGVTGAKFARAWRSWKGESLRDSIERGGKLYAADMKRMAKLLK